ncbi:MAG: hypothetical protein RIQ56_561, partial [Candidatus Parcubacteria bacterium]
WKQLLGNLRHELACEKFLAERGYGALGKIVASHGLRLPPGAHATIEQKILYYADKRVLIDRVVELEERFADFRKRYGKMQTSKESEQWYNDVKTIERTLFPDGTP